MKVIHNPSIDLSFRKLFVPFIDRVNMAYLWDEILAKLGHHGTEKRWGAVLPQSWVGSCAWQPDRELLSALELTPY